MSDSGDERAIARAVGARLRFVDGLVKDAGGGFGRDSPEDKSDRLARRRFAFRSWSYTGKLVGFLDAIVRAQIDRLMPVVGGPPRPPSAVRADGTAGRCIGVIVAATAESSGMPFVTAVEALKPGSIVVSARPDDESGKAPSQSLFFLGRQIVNYPFGVCDDFLSRRPRSRAARPLRRSRPGYLSAPISRRRGFRSRGKWPNAASRS